MTKYRACYCMAENGDEHTYGEGECLGHGDYICPECGQTAEVILYRGAVVTRCCHEAPRRNNAEWSPAYINSSELDG